MTSCASLQGAKLNLLTLQTLTPSTTALMCHWEDASRVCGKVCTAPIRAELFCAMMQMTAFIKGALLVMHCVSYQSFPQSLATLQQAQGYINSCIRLCQRSLIRQSRVCWEWPATSLIRSPSFLCAWWDSLSLFYICLSQYRFAVWDSQAHYKYKGVSKSGPCPIPPPFFCMKWITSSGLHTWTAQGFLKIRFLMQT